MSYLIRLKKKGLINPEHWVYEQLQYEVIMGSFAYAINDDTSDLDVYGFCIPPKEYLFPHLNGVIYGYDKQVQGFEQWQKHHVVDKTIPQEYDFTIYNIVKYFRLCADNNPNMVDSLFVPRRCITFQTPIGEMIRENRKLFLHKGCFHKFKGYAYSMLHKEDIKEPEGYQELIKFEKDNNIPHTTTLEEIETELEKRGLKT